MNESRFSETPQAVQEVNEKINQQMEFADFVDNATENHYGRGIEIMDDDDRVNIHRRRVGVVLPLSDTQYLMVFKTGDMILTEALGGAETSSREKYQTKFDALNEHDLPNPSLSFSEVDCPDTRSVIRYFYDKGASEYEMKIIGDTILPEDQEKMTAYKKNLEMLKLLIPDSSQDSHIKQQLFPENFLKQFGTSLKDTQPPRHKGHPDSNKEE